MRSLAALLLLTLLLTAAPGALASHEAMNCVDLASEVFLCQRPGAIGPHWVVVEGGSGHDVYAGAQQVSNPFFDDVQVNVQGAAYYEVFLLPSDDVFLTTQVRQGGAGGPRLAFVTLEHQAHATHDFYGVCVTDQEDESMRRCVGVGLPEALPLP